LEPPKSPSPFTYDVLTYLWVIGLSILGGIVSFLRKLREGHARAFNIVEFVGEVFTSGFAGLLTFWLCQAGNIDPLLTAVFIGIAGHMGSRALFLIEKWAEARFPKA
jgi:hypothetical protein